MAKRISAPTIAAASYVPTIAQGSGRSTTRPHRQCRVIAIEDEAIIEVLKMQRNAGIEIYSDGEFRRAFWNCRRSPTSSSMASRTAASTTNASDSGGKDVADHEELVPQYPVVVDRLRIKDRITGDEIKFLRKHSPGPFKMTCRARSCSSRRNIARHQ